MSNHRVVSVVVLVMWLTCSFAVAQSQVNARQLVQQCQLKDFGSDQTSRLSMVLRDSTGRERKSVYHRYWKSYANGGDLNEKMMLFTEYPPDAKGAAFMRWGYRSSSNKKAQHWIYLPELKKIRRLSVRDMADRFLGSELTYADISFRELDEDTHKFVGRHQTGQDKYVLVASVPKDKSFLYSKRIHWFKLGKSWYDCVVARTDYYDHKNQLLKKQYYNWQNVNGVWLWKEVLVENMQTYRSSLFTVDNAVVNTGIKDSYFVERTLRHSQISNITGQNGFALH